MASSDKITIKDLGLETTIGVLAWERVHPQRLVLNITVYCDLSAAGESDDLADTINYKALVDSVLEFAQNNQFQLLESFAAQLIKTLFAKYEIEKITLDVDKPAILKEAKSVAISLTREKANV